MAKMRQRLSEVVNLVVEREESGANSARAKLEELTANLTAAGAEALLSAFVAIVESGDEPRATCERNGDIYRYKESVKKDWFAPFGVATINRRSYASPEGGSRYVPCDERWGMRQRFLTPEVEEVVTFASALNVPDEIEQLLAKSLPQAPSSTAIKRAIRDVGDFLETNTDAVESKIAADRPLASKGDNLVVSWDGAMVPTRAYRSTDWKEAGIARISLYETMGPEDRAETDERTKMVDHRYIGRMPESGMSTLLDRLAVTVGDLRADRNFENFVIICDGKDSIWNAAASRAEFSGAILVLDFYHATQHLSAAAKAIFGESSPRAQSWFEQRRHALRHTRGEIDRILRALRRFLGRLRDVSKEHTTVRRAIKHFEKNRERMRYREFVDLGLPIGSGPVESAAKNIVNHRLKRSGMRWTIDGGQRILTLRSLVKDGRWDQAWQTYRDRDAA